MSDVVVSVCCCAIGLVFYFVDVFVVLMYLSC